ncbi:hypothetical protein SUNI508_09509 [Seiridium unicorne]|uniref:FAD-binding PCMH-type domain-containing protein n=1 Tax=Seiridium unicorne TaxID=138068 RepID=A0ABR2UQY4_9PEZI
MASYKILSDLPVDKRLGLIKDQINSNDNIDKSEPGHSELLKLLDGYFGDKVDHIDFLRGLLRVYRESKTDKAYQSFVKDKLTDDERDRVERFVTGAKAVEAGRGFQIPHSIGSREEAASLDRVSQVVIPATAPSMLLRESSDESFAKIDINAIAAPQTGIAGLAHKLAAFLWNHGHDDEVKVWDSTEFQNWGRTVAFTPKYTIWPKTVRGIINIVRFAKQEGLGVRCSGYRHSWSPIFGRQGQIILSTLDPSRVSRLPDLSALPLEGTKPNELETIDIVDPGEMQATQGKTLVRVGTAVTNERLRRWCIQKGKITLPFNVIMVELTLGGSNAPICHGAGLKHQSLSDLVRKVEYVDCHGKFQTVTDLKQLRAASGCFGLMGVVTHITMEFDAMTYAQLAPQKLDAVVAIPPPDGLEQEIPPALRKHRTPEQSQQDIANFEKACANDYYAEWFWFPYSDQVWVNTWNTTTDASDVVEYPSDVDIFIQWAGTVLGNISQNSGVLDAIGNLTNLPVSTTLLSRAAMWNLGEKKVKTYLTDGLHFQRGIQNIRVRDLEVEMPIPGKGSGQGNSSIGPDWTYIRRAWWDAIIIAYEHIRDQPQQMPLEMRVMGDSNVIMAPQRDNTFGTCSIEILTLEAEKEKWPAYSQRVLDAWMSYKDEAGRPLRTRPHWAKEWHGYTVQGRKWPEKLKEDYKVEIVEFKETLAIIGKSHGWTLDEIKQRFSNDFFDDFIFGETNSTSA